MTERDWRIFREDYNITIKGNYRQSSMSIIIFLNLILILLRFCLFCRRQNPGSDPKLERGQLPVRNYGHYRQSWLQRCDADPASSYPYRFAGKHQREMSYKILQKKFNRLNFYSITFRIAILSAWLKLVPVKRSLSSFLYSCGSSLCRKLREWKTLTRYDPLTPLKTANISIIFFSPQSLKNATNSTGGGK